ncbi:ANTAR domain-containing response regulator [Desmospora profundinema]|uniref:Response regulator NasT n=1 Tax=Desmospora profundinema TaxID=1571184 RepID=A0ABU1IS44_9BACL|nr:ANTAR domain-containing protein [Desmospora profundinema]MDR6226739.1 response regulator NasT [Desmospora profundinema]
MKSLLWVSDHTEHDKPDTTTPSATRKSHTDEALRQHLTNTGFQVITTTYEDVEEYSDGIDAIVWSVPAASLPVCQQRFPSVHYLPQLWRCDGSDPNRQRIERLGHVDGILYDGMDDNQVQWALRISLLHHQQRTEYQRLERKLEERKWIDQAKWILRDAKQLSEAEAYQIIRKQAMNERKPMADIAHTIVQVHRLLHSSRPGGD